MGRNRKKDYFCQVKESREAFWHKPNNSVFNYRYFHLILALNNDYCSTSEVVRAIKVLEPYFGEIPHYTDYMEEKSAIERANPEGMEKLMVFNSKVSHKSSGWEVDLWCFKELSNWDMLKKIKN